jgi:hypothetical protein
VLFMLLGPAGGGDAPGLARSLGSLGA